MQPYGTALFLQINGIFIIHLHFSWKHLRPIRLSGQNFLQIFAFRSIATIFSISFNFLVSNNLENFSQYVRFIKDSDCKTNHIDSM